MSTLRLYDLPECRRRLATVTASPSGGKIIRSDKYRSSPTDSTVCNREPSFSLMINLIISFVNLDFVCVSVVDVLSLIRNFEALTTYQSWQKSLASCWLLDNDSLDEATLEIHFSWNSSTILLQTRLQPVISDHRQDTSSHLHFSHAPVLFSQRLSSPAWCTPSPPLHLHCPPQQ